MLIKYIFYFLLQFYFAKELTGKIIYEFDEGDVFLTVKQSENNKNLLRAETRSKNNEIISYSKIQLDGNSTGWNTITSWTNPKYNDEMTSYNVGKNEGIISRQIAYNHWYNYIRTFCDNQEEICVNIKKFIKLNIEWIETMLKKYKTTDEYWWHVNLVYTQLKGFVAGYNLNTMSGVEDSSPKLTYTDFLLLNLRGDLYDLVDKYKPKGSPPSKLYEEGHCSAIIKLLPGNKDLYVGHNTWSRYNTMTRAIKAYKFTYHKLPNSEEFIPGKTVSFSGYPAEIHSHDDFYVISSGLAVQETTIGNYNEKLWDFVTPEGIVFEFVRIMVANRLATDGKSWSKIFSKYNSGTYNNQWMVVDYNKFTSGKPPKKGLLWILEQIPGHVRYADQTSILEKQKYWPSYNVPFYKDIFKLGGNEELVRQYGEWFSYEGAPRAKIFRRDHKKIKSMKSFMDFMRYNNYAHDSYSKCNCTPPYSASNAVAARHDLNPASGTYPFPALGHRGGGATDAKLTNSLLVKKMRFVAVSGPTTGTNLPVFKWSTSDFKDTMPHLGQPDEWNFKPIIAG